MFNEGDLLINKFQNFVGIITKVTSSYVYIRWSPSKNFVDPKDKFVDWMLEEEIFHGFLEHEKHEP